MWSRDDVTPTGVYCVFTPTVIGMALAVISRTTHGQFYDHAASKEINSNLILPPGGRSLILRFFLVLGAFL